MECRMQRRRTPRFKALSAWGLALGALLVCFAGAPPKAVAQSWLKRQYHHTTSRFNGLYYARLRHEEAMQEIMKAHQDDYAQRLPVYVVSLDAAVNSGASAFEESIKKCSNVIQRKEHSRWIDESFLLIGECYYLRRNFFDAIETFQYIAGKYKGTPNADLAQTWLIRCYTSTKQFNRAQSVLDRALEQKKFSREHLGSLHLAAAEAQLAQGRLQKGSEYLELALLHRLPRAQKRRVHFLLGQLYLDLESRKAPAHFKSALRLRPEPEMAFQCKIKMVTAYTDVRQGSKNARRILLQLIQSKKYFAYKDVLYYEYSLIDKAEKKFKSMLENLNKSLQHATEINAQRKKTWLALADHYFDTKAYALAQLYFDSLSQHTDKDFPRFREIRNKAQYLSEMVRNLKIVANQDSLLELGALPENRLLARIDRILEEERKAEATRKAQSADSARSAAAAAQTNAYIDPLLLQRSMTSAPTAASGGEWHFYNTQILGADLNQFLQLWGKRENTDHWRRSNRGKSEAADGDLSDTDQDQSPEAALEDSLAKLPRTRESLLLRIPRDPEARDKALESVRKAHLALAKIYKDRFTDYPEAVVWLSQHRDRFPKSPTEPEVLYQAYLCYDLMKKAALRDQTRNLLDSLYPNSSFVALLKGNLAQNSDSLHEQADLHYRYCYKLYESGHYDSVVLQCKFAKSRFASDSLMPYFGYLETVSAARHDTALLVQSLQGMVQRNSSGNITLAATRLLDLLTGSEGTDPNGANRIRGSKEKVQDRYEFKADSLQPYFLVLRMDASVYKKNIEIGVKISRFAERFYRNYQIKLAYPVYKEIEQLVLIRELPDLATAQKFWKEAAADPELFKDLKKEEYHWFYATKDNYNKLFKNLSLNEYLSFFEFLIQN